ncbi:MAG: ABC transporter ATP-binding protein [Hyphomicrobiales bacterium]
MSKPVEIRSLSRRYGSSVQALRDVSLAVEAGEFVTLLGPSGSGKSTILKLIAGLDQPSSGDILIDGRSVLDIPPYRRGIGMVFQNYALFPHMTIAENIAFPLRVRDLPADETARRVADILGKTHLEGLEHRYPRELSGGQQQRVALARAIVFDPKVLLMDEPLGALDRRLREELKYEIKSLHERLQITILFVTHDQDEALVMSDRIAVMRDGMLEQVSPPRELYTRPGNIFVANFVGEANILACEVRQGWLWFDGEPLDETVPRQFGDHCCLMLRPEMIDIAEGGRPGRLRGRLSEVAFLGESTRCVVETGTARIIVRLPNRGGQPWALGDEVSLNWAAQSAVCFPGR